MTTLRRDLRIKFLEILDIRLENVGDTTKTSLATELAEAAMTVKFLVEEKSKKQKLDLQKSDPAWSILFGEEIDTTDNILAKEARDAFERDMNFNPLPWSSTKKWEKLEELVVREYPKDKLIFAKYKTWQKNEGKYVSLSNKRIKANPEDFVACWPDFLAHYSMYSKPQESRDVQLDANGIPLSY